MKTRLPANGYKKTKEMNNPRETTPTIRSDKNRDQETLMEIQKNICEEMEIEITAPEVPSGVKSAQAFRTMEASIQAGNTGAYPIDLRPKEKLSEIMDKAKSTNTPEVTVPTDVRSVVHYRNMDAETLKKIKDEGGVYPLNFTPEEEELKAEINFKPIPGNLEFWAR